MRRGQRAPGSYHLRDGCGRVGGWISAARNWRGAVGDCRGILGGNRRDTRIQESPVTEGDDCVGQILPQDLLGTTGVEDQLGVGLCMSKRGLDRRRAP
jgi:hypothetical protein